MLDCDLSPVLELGYYDSYELIGELRSHRDVVVVCDNPQELSRTLVESSDVWTQVRHVPIARLAYPNGGVVHFLSDLRGYRGGADTIYLIGAQHPEIMDQVMIYKSGNPWIMIRRLRL